jgi:dihydroorotate dehydrogenase (NAD+) catalytic subunit
MDNGLKAKNPDLSVDLGRGLALKNPVMTASGTFAYGEEASKYFDISLLGAIVVKGISLEPRQGNPPPRIVETPSGMLNSIGLQNVGVDLFLSEKLPFLGERGATVVVNILGSSTEEYLRVAELLSPDSRISALEVNISCPNVKEGGVQFGMNPDTASGLISSLRETTDLHLMVKLTPNYGDIAGMARAVEDAGADSLSLINTITGMVIDVGKKKPVLGSVVGGLSGPAIRPVALRMVYEAAGAVDIPVVGIGGISETDDALQFLIAGAAAVQVGTATFIDPGAPVNILEGIRSCMKDEGMSALSEIVNSLKLE